ncbi:MAG: hypothetical protein AB7O52_19365 [Planctomycetota bacterium]
MMREVSWRSFGLVLTAAMLGGGVVLFAQDVFEPSHLLYSHRQTEAYEMSIGVTGQGSPAKDRRVEEVREVLLLPDFYGPLLAVQPSGTSTVFWFQDSHGVIRNTIVERSAERALAIRTQPTRKLEVAVERDAPR